MSKTFRHLWPQIVSFPSLHNAYLKARRGKRYETEVLRFSANLEQELLKLLNELESGTYRTGKYRRFHVYEPKKREVAALPFRDRVVQHALVAAIEPIYERRFIHDSYACRIGKGTHAGADRLTEFLRRAHRQWRQTYVLKADVSKFFPSVDHARLKEVLRRYIVCHRTLELIDGIIGSWSRESGRGIPIGNLTSQLFANIYLHELDEFVKFELRWGMYVRYMDDTVFLGSDKTELNRVRYRVDQFLREQLHLTLNPKTAIYPEAQGIDFLGYRVWRTHRLLRKSSAKRMRRKLKVFARRYAAGMMNLDDVRASISAWLGHASHADTFALRQQLFDSVIFQRRHNDDT